MNRAIGKAPRRRLELELENTATDWLALDGWRSLKTDPVSDRSTAGAILRALLAVLPQHAELIRKTVAKMTRGKGFGEIGMNDRLYIRYKKNETNLPGLYLPWAEVLWIEWKIPSGKPTEDQLRWTAAEKARGALSVIAGIDFPATFDGFRKWYVESGLARRIR
jgi:hypothetical protein